MDCKAQERVAVARDALDQLARGRFKARTRHWLVVNGVDLKKPLLGDSIQKASCEVCAKGALFVAWLDRHAEDDVSTAEFVEHSSSNEHQVSMTDSGEKRFLLPMLEKVFDRSQLDMMEAVFEQRVQWTEYSMLEPRERLAAILQNVIDNGGRFVPPLLLVGPPITFTVRL